MGIRFQCPNGHSLNVKSYLAGKKGICPECNARFLVPEASVEPSRSDKNVEKVSPPAPVEPSVSPHPESFSASKTSESHVPQTQGAKQPPGASSSPSAKLPPEPNRSAETDLHLGTLSTTTAPSSAALTNRNRVKNRKKRQMQITFWLAMMVVLLSSALLFVVFK